MEARKCVRKMMIVGLAVSKNTQKRGKHCQPGECSLSSAGHKIHLFLFMDEADEKILSQRGVLSNSTVERSGANRNAASKIIEDNLAAAHTRRAKEE